MKFRADGYNWVVRLEKGEKLLEQLTSFAKDNDIPSCWISAIGACQQAELGYYDLEKQEYHWHKVDELMEITGIQGNLAWDGDTPVFHLHGNFSKEDLSTVGGHIKNLVVGGTCEVFFHRWYADKLTRSQDSEVGLKLLDL